MSVDPEDRSVRGEGPDAAEAPGSGPPAVREAARHLESAFGDLRPRLAVVAGSGLGGLADRVEGRVVVPYREIPGWPVPSVPGHAGEAVGGRLGGVEVVVLSGRPHLYEGHPPARVAFPVRAMAELGAEGLLVTNAAGAVNRRFRPGQLMLVRDQLNLAWRHPLAGPPREGEERWPDMHDAYDAELAGVVRAVAAEEGVLLREGVYAGVLGPSYETPAEVRMLSRLGADAVGMSTVPEVLVARALGVRCVGLSCLTNYAAGRGPGEMTHDEVVETAGRVGTTLETLVVGALGELADRL